MNGITTFMFMIIFICSSKYLVGMISNDSFVILFLDNRHYVVSPTEGEGRTGLCTSTTTAGFQAKMISEFKATKSYGTA